MNSVLVIIPAHNEGAVVGETVSAVVAIGLSVLVVDDASSDETVTQARRNGANVMPLSSQLGAWGATQAGMRYALRQGYDIVITMDADGQHDPHAISLLLSKLSEGSKGLIVGACTKRGSRARKIAWGMFRLLSGLQVEDLTSGFRVYSRSAFALLSTKCATMLDYQDVGVLCLLRSAGIRVAEVEVCMFPRKDGKSRIFNSWISVAKYMLYSMILSVSHFRPMGGK